MLARYKMYRGKRPVGDPLPDGVRQDTRKHTRHCLRPPDGAVAKYLAAPSDVTWERFVAEYNAALEARVSVDAAPFDRLAELARRGDVFIGCSCPTAKNPDPDHCHTILALEFMAARYPDLRVKPPKA